MSFQAELRKTLRHYSAQEVAEYLCVSRPTIDYWLKGQLPFVGMRPGLSLALRKMRTVLDDMVDALEEE